jgi:hypothetical protein
MRKRLILTHIFGKDRDKGIDKAEILLAWAIRVALPGPFAKSVCKMWMVGFPIPLPCQRPHQAGQRPLLRGWRICIMFSYTSAISKKWLAIVFHGLKLGNIRNPFGHSSAILSAIL